METDYVLITAARNEEKYIEKTIGAVCNQTVPPKKWVIINDGSTDRTEEIAEKYSKVHRLLSKAKGLEIVNLDREDECCGFGGTFSVFNPDVSVKMGKQRIADHEKNGAEYITATDMSCLMHLEGIIRRQNRPVKIMHIAEILNSGKP